jgi:site-specific DNA recombinase
MKASTKKDKLRQFAKGKAQIVTNSDSQNCVIYTRVSSKEQMDTNQSLEWQKKYCDEYAHKNKLTIVGCFGGTYESAKSDERKEFNKMLKFVKASKQKISYILVYSLDRFSRTGDSAIYISSELKKTGVNILAVTQPIDTNSHAGALQQNIQFIFSKYDNDLRRQKSIDGMHEKLLRGERLGNCPIGYKFTQGGKGKVQVIEFSDKAPYIKQAFEWRAMGYTMEVISEKLKMQGISMPKQTMTSLFKNPFYCGYISHNFLGGELVRGKHEPLISEELFLTVTNQRKTDGFKVNKFNDNVPLKVFVKDHASNEPFTGYIVKKKGLYYYKVNKIGVKVNRSIKIMHDKFKEVLDDLTIDNKYVEPLIKQLHYTWDNLNESSKTEKQSLAKSLNDLEAKLDLLERRHAFGEINGLLFEKFSKELYEQQKQLAEALQNLSENLSNPKSLIDFTLGLSTKLPSVWTCGDYHKKQDLQYMLFPVGLTYDTNIEHYRTTQINSVFAYIAHQSRDLEETKNRTSHIFDEKSDSVPRRRLELPHLAAYAPQAYLYTIPTPGHVILPANRQE